MGVTASATTGPTAPPQPGVALGPRSSVLLDRALELLAHGPVPATEIVSVVCQLPSIAPGLAEHLATALLASDPRFARTTDGRWGLVSFTAAPPAVVDLTGGSYVVVDVETTGSRAAGGDRITEIAAVLVRDGREQVVFDSLINPERSIPPYITRLTRITGEMVATAPRFAEVAPQLAGVLEGHVFVAHNASFDWAFVSMEMERATGRPLLGRRLCTVRLARKLLPGLRRRSLDHVAAHYDIQIEARHRAGGDAVATARILLRLLDAAAGSGCATLDDVERLLSGAGPRKPRRAPATPHAVTRDTTA